LKKVKIAVILIVFVSKDDSFTRCCFTPLRERKNVPRSGFKYLKNETTCAGDVQHRNAKQAGYTYPFESFY